MANFSIERNRRSPFERVALDESNAMCPIVQISADLTDFWNKRERLGRFSGSAFIFRFALSLNEVIMKFKIGYKNKMFM